MHARNENIDGAGTQNNEAVRFLEHRTASARQPILFAHLYQLLSAFVLRHLSLFAAMRRIKMSSSVLSSSSD